LRLTYRDSGRVNRYLLILSDLHNEFQPFQPVPTDADVVILAGDIDVKARSGQWAARAFGASKGWTRLEVTTPPLPAFERTLAFYEREGFAITGGRKLKTLL